jgi:hypothetical protein
MFPAFFPSWSRFFKSATLHFGLVLYLKENTHLHVFIYEKFDIFLAGTKNHARDLLYMILWLEFRSLLPMFAVVLVLMTMK